MIGVTPDQEDLDFAEITQVAHGFTLPSHGFLPLYYNNTNSQYELAQADSVEKAADVMAIGFPDANTITIVRDGHIKCFAHGLTVGKWYVLDKSVAGGIVTLDTLTGVDEKVQYLAFAYDASNIEIRMDPIFVEDFEVFVPQDIEILEDWADGTQPVTISAGNDRHLIVGTMWEDAGGTSVTGMTVGGIAGALIEEQSVVSGFQQGASLYCWLEADIVAMVGSTLAISWASGAPDGSQNYAALIEHVDQSSPVPDMNSDLGTGGTDTLDADVDTIDGGYAVMISGGGNTGMGFTNNGAGWTRKLNLTIPSADGVVDDKLIVTGQTPENMNMSISGSNRHTLVAASFRRRES